MNETLTGESRSLVNARTRQAETRRPVSICAFLAVGPFRVKGSLRFTELIVTYMKLRVVMSTFKLTPLGDAGLPLTPRS